MHRRDVADVTAAPFGVELAGSAQREREAEGIAEQPEDQPGHAQRHKRSARQHLAVGRQERPDDQREQPRARVGEQQCQDEAGDAQRAPLPEAFGHQRERHDEREARRLAEEESVRFEERARLEWQGVETPPAPRSAAGTKRVKSNSQSACSLKELGIELCDAGDGAGEGQVRERARHSLPVEPAFGREHENERQIDRQQQQQRRRRRTAVVGERARQRQAGADREQHQPHGDTATTPVKTPSASRT